MNLLTDALPTAVLVDGAEVAVNCDHRTCLRILCAFEDNTLTGWEKQAILLANLYPQVPPNTSAAITQGIRFLDGGAAAEAEAAGAAQARLYSFQKDQRYIFAAFRQTHGIDLETAQLHWWKFLALFLDLGQETTFCSLVALRKRVQDGSASKEERRTALELGGMFEVEKIDNRSIEEREREAEFMRLVNGGV